MLMSEVPQRRPNPKVDKRQEAKADSYAWHTCLGTWSALLCMERNTVGLFSRGAPLTHSSSEGTIIASAPYMERLGFVVMFRGSG